MKMLAAGELRSQVTIQLWSDEANEQSSLDQNFVDVSQVWAKVETLETTIFSGLVQVNENVTHRFYIRHRDGITNDNVLKYNDIRYRIRQVYDLDFKGRFLVVEAEELGY